MMYKWMNIISLKLKLKKKIHKNNDNKKQNTLKLLANSLFPNCAKMLHHYQ